MDDFDLCKVIELKSQDLPKPPFFVWADSPTLGTLWHGWDAVHIINGLLVKGLHGIWNMFLSFLQAIHSSPFSGHLGITRTLNRARQSFYWHKMSSHIADYVRSCSNCAENKLGVHNNSCITIYRY